MNPDRYSKQIENGQQALDPFSWTKKFTLSDEEAEMIADPKWVFPNLVIHGHVAVYPAPPNGGKTTIFNWVAGEIAGDYQVFYVNADISGSDAKLMQAQAKERGFSLLLPDMKAGLSMDDVVENLIAMNLQNQSYDSHVFIFDTLKKMTNVIHKDKAKELYKTLRGLSAKGMTIILLAHTNKYNDAEGKPIYEGTGDLRSDVDELIYLIPKKNDDGSMTVSTEPDKVRGSFEPLTFNISPDREVSLADEFIDVAEANRRSKQLQDDESIIQAVTEAITQEKFKQTEIISHCKELGIGGRRQVEKVLNRYSKQPVKLWQKQKAFQNNAIQYHLSDTAHPL